MPLPQGSTDSQVLDEFMIGQIIDILPPRAEGYPWIQVIFIIVIVILFKKTIY